jgi:hypothetical protein
METRIVDEKIYGLPFEAVPLAVFYSIQAFEELDFRRAISRKPGISSSKSRAS